MNRTDALLYLVFGMTGILFGVVIGQHISFH